MIQMIERLFFSRKFWLFAALALGLYLLFRNPIRQWFLAIQTGKVAAIDANTLNGYTTYNTSLYNPPSWLPQLNFFKANSYVPVREASTTQQTQYTTGNVQG